MKDYVGLEKTEYFHFFTSDKNSDFYTLKEDRDQIKVFSKDESNKIWDKYFSPNAWHWMLLDTNDNPLESIKVGDINIEFEKVEEVQAVMKKDLGEDEKIEIFIFLSRDCTIKTQWGLFLRYIDNFECFVNEGQVIKFKGKNKYITFHPHGLYYINKSKKIIEDDI